MAFDAYMKIDGIPGETTDSNHQDWIEILNVHYTFEQNVSGTASSAGGATAGRVNFHDLHVSKYIDKASPKLMEACASGQHFKTVTIDIHRAGGKQVKYLTLKLEEVIISQLSAGTSQQAEFPSEDLLLNYGRISMSYVQQKRSDGQGSGSVTGGWDRIANRKHA